MRLCGQVTRYARITGRVKYDVAAGLTEALTPVQTTHFAAVTLPDDIGQLLRDIDAYVGYTSVVYCLKILPYVFTRPSELRLAHWSEFDFKKRHMDHSGIAHENAARACGAVVQTGAGLAE